MDKLNRIYQGDCLEVLKTFPDNSIDCCVTSPPYYALRDYGVNGQIGLETTFTEYINKLLDLFDEVKRVLKPSGACWVNLGDSYSGSGGWNEWKEEWTSKTKQCKTKQANILYSKLRDKSIIPKSLMQIPARFSIGMTDRGWILRNEIIWYKRNCMPSSATDRFTVDFEKLFFFVKNKKYYFEQQFENFESNDYDRKRMESRKEYHGKWSEGYNSMPNLQRAFVAGSQQGRNKRCVWTINTKPYKEAHFATFPETLIETPIKAGCPEFICDKCGKAREKVYGRGEFIQTGGGRIKETPAISEQQKVLTGYRKPIDNGYSSCSCNSTFSGGIVLDPFFGSGTTGVVALKQNKNFVGIELNPEYIEIAEKRLELYKLKLAI